jgi:secreted PhoX family phosphatase
MFQSFDQLAARRLPRRAMLGGLGASAFLLSACGTNTKPPVASAATAIDFASLPRALDATHHIAAGYDASILIRWGDPLFADSPPFQGAAPTPEGQVKQFGFNNDFLAFMPLPRGSNESDHGLLWVNHEYVEPGMAFATFDAAAPTPQQIAALMAMHGGSVIEVKRDREGWRVVPASGFARRITASTPATIAGPAAGHALLQTKEDPTGRLVLGTLGNCAGGKTPWGTVLSGEENFYHYFDASNAQSLPLAAMYDRYELRRRGRFTFASAVERFDIAKDANEPHRFGWVVEIDPYDPDAKPVKRTALGRFKHEGATLVVNHDGRVVIYSGDDERFEYIYRFVSKGRYDPNDRDANRTLLDEGVLSVARFEEDSVEWLPLAQGQGPLTAANGFASQAEVLIFARRAGDLLGATRMDRPEDIAVSPATGKVYVALTFNERRTPEQIDAANPAGPNQDGHIVEMIPPMVAGGVDHAADRFAWEIFALGGGNDETAGAHFSRPDNLLFDPAGRLWIATDQGPGQAKFGTGDCLYVCETEGDARAKLRRFFIGPRDAELTGPEMTPDGSTLFVSVQHPGEPRDGGPPKILANATTRWPDFKDDTPPRPSVVAITRRGGGAIGGGSSR